MKKRISELLEELELFPPNVTKDGKVTHTTDNKFIVVEDLDTIASFLEGNPIAGDVVKAVMDLIWNGDHAGALAYLEKEHQSLKDPIMSLVHLNPHVASKVAKGDVDVKNLRNYRLADDAIGNE